MVKAVVFDFGRVLIFPKDKEYFGGLNELHRVLSESPNYKFSDHFVFNDELLQFIKEEKVTKRFESYLFTKGKIINSPECKSFLENVFANVFSADLFKIKKSDTSTYSFLADKIDIAPPQILYVDDTRTNTEAAENAGLQTITFRNNMQFETEFRGYIL